jgi:hypothetical protein
MISHSASVSTSYPSYTYNEYTTATSRPRTRRSTARPGTARPRTGASTIARIEAQQVVCAITESRGISPTVGVAFINLDTGEAVLCQICDSQTYVKTVHKLRVYGPSEILIVSTASSPKSKLFSIIEENLEIIESKLTLLDRRYWAESTGYDYIQSLAFPEDVEAIKTSVKGNYYAVCSIAAVRALPLADLHVTQTSLGAQVHRTRPRKNFSDALSQVQIRNVRRFYDDRCIHHLFARTSSKSSESEIKRLLIRSAERDTDTNGSTTLEE